MRRWARRQHPGVVGLVALVSAAWLVVVAGHLAGAAGWFGHDRLTREPARVVAAWMVMTVAMMGPSCLPLVRYVSANTFRPRRAVASFGAGYLAVWAAFLGVFAVADTAAHAFAPDGGGSGSGAVLLAAAGWQAGGAKRRFLRACRSVGVLPARGGAACLRLGVRQGVSCVGSCGPLMLATMAVAYGRLAWMPALAALAWCERAAGLGRRLARPAAAVLAAAGLAYLAAGY